MDFKQIPEEQVCDLINKHMFGRPFFNNYFGIDLSSVDVFEKDYILLIRKKCEGFYRIYALVQTEELFVELLDKLPKDYVLNIPTRKDISMLDKLFINHGWKRVAVYNRYSNKRIKKRNAFIPNFAAPVELDLIYDMLYQNFSSITGYLPTREELKVMIDQNNILVDRNESNVICGIIGYRIDKNKCYLPFWIDKEGNGLNLLFSVYNIAIDNGVKLIYFWVNDINVDTIRIHTLLGATKDGLTDYIYMK